MNADQFRRAFAIADKRDATGRCEIDLSNEDDSQFDGCALPGFQPIVATVRQVAKLMRYQAMYLNGRWDMEELNELQRLLRHKVTILD